MAQYRIAVRAKCEDCTYDPGEPGTAIAQIRSCLIPLCPLWVVRPIGPPSQQARAPFNEGVRESIKRTARSSGKTVTDEEIDAWQADLRNPEAIPAAFRPQKRG